MKTSENGISLIKRWEQFRKFPYQDSAGVWTQGYGHTRTTTINSKPINESQATQLLKSDLEQVEAFINAYFNLKQCQFDALASFLFNLGVNSLRNTHLHELLLSNPESKNIADEWIEFRNAGGEYLRGLMRRRIDEISMYYSW